MTDARLKFGDVVRVDPEANPEVPQPDDRRWMIVSFDDRLKWTTLYVGPTMGPGTSERLSHWSNMTGFIRVDE